MTRGAPGGWRTFAAVVVGNAAVQTALIAGDPVPEMRWGFGALVAASLIGVVAAVWLTVQTAVGERQFWRAGLAWSAGWVLLAAVVAVVALLASPVVLVLGLFVLPAAAAGERNPVGAAVRLLRRSPGRSALVVLGAAAAIALAWVVALVLGFFITGAPAAFATWLCLGLVMTATVRSATALYRRGSAVAVAAGER